MNEEQNFVEVDGVDLSGLTQGIKTEKKGIRSMLIKIAKHIAIEKNDKKQLNKMIDDFNKASGR